MQRSLQVVGVLALAGSSCRTGGEQFLNPAEDLGGDERLVGAGVLHLVPLHSAHVDRVGENLGQALPGDRRRGLGSAAPVGEAPVGQLGGEALEGPLPAGVMLEGHRDERGAIWVGDDTGDLVAADQLPEVHVAERCAVREATLLAFCVMPFLISEARLAE